MKTTADRIKIQIHLNRVRLADLRQLKTGVEQALDLYHIPYIHDREWVNYNNLIIGLVACQEQLKTLIFE